MSTTVLTPRVPLYQRGANPIVAHYNHVHRVRAPRLPLHQLGGLGVNEAAIIGTAAPIAAKAATSAAAIIGVTSAAVPIVGAAVGVVVSLIAGLLAGHEKRKKQAQNENSAMNLGVQSFDSDLKTIQQALKSGQISSSDALNAVAQTAMPGYWTIVGGQIQPGRNGCNTGQSCPPPSPPGVNPCKGNIGAACCVGCFDLLLSITNPDGVLAAIQGMSTSPQGKYVAQITEVYGSKYGGQQRNAYTLDWTPPASALASAGSALSSLASGGSSNLLLIGGVALAALLLLR